MLRALGAQGVLAEWADAGPVAIVQPLPQRLWGYTSVAPVNVRIKATEPGVPNKKLRYEELYESYAPGESELDGESEEPPPVPVPVIELSSVAASSWSRLVTAGGTDAIDTSAMLLGTSADPIAKRDRLNESRYSPEDLVRRFQMVASANAMRLAECLAAVPVSVPVMRLIQEAVLGNEDNTAIAEVFLGGLLRRIGSADPEIVQYDFLPDVREFLRRRLPRTESLNVLLTVADAIGRRLGRAREFRALIAGEGIDGEMRLDSASMPFAVAAAPVLARLGGQYATSARRIQALIGESAGSEHEALAGGGHVAAAGAVLAAAEAGRGNPPDQGRPETGLDLTAQGGRPGSPGSSIDLAAFSEALGNVTLPPGRSTDRPLTCPYCYHSFARQHIMFRCSGIPRPDHPPCARKADPVLQREMNIGLLMFPIFHPKGRGDMAQCPDCLGQTTEQACPNCHISLPPGFRSLNSGLVALIGSSETGKTAFMTVLIHELRHSVGAQLGSSTMSADDTTQERFTRDYWEPLYQEGSLFGRTTSRGEGYIRPLVFRMKVPSRSSRRGRLQELLLSFADSAGEDLVSPGKVSLMARYLAAADAVMLMIDPLQLEPVRRSITTDVAMPTRQEPVTSLERVTRLLQAGAKSDVIEKPTAVVITKLDAILDLLPAKSVLRRRPATMSPFDLEDSASVQDEVSQFLERYGAGQIDMTLTRRFANWRYFAVSALGAPPTSENTLSSASIHPHRIADPMLWILNVFGIAQRRDR